MKVTLHSEIEAADLEARTLSGRIVPFGEVGSPKNSLGVRGVMFRPGSINVVEASQIKLNREHERTSLIGKASHIEAREDGLWATFKVANTTAGNDALQEAVEGLRTSFSIEASIESFERINDIAEVTAATLTGTAHVAYPAFSSAQITEVAASEDEEQTSDSEQAEADVPPNQEETPMENIETPDVEAAKVEASTPQPVVYTQPRSGIVDSLSYLNASIDAAMGDTEKAMWVKAADDSISTNTGLTLPQHLDQFVTSTFGSRPAIEAIGVRALPSDGMSFTIPTMGTAPTVATVAEGGAPSETGMTSSYTTVSVIKKSGINRVSFELLERSRPAFADLLLEEMRKAYAKNTDEYVIAQMTAGGTQATATAGTVAGLQSFIATEAPAAWAATGGEFATTLLANQAWWTALVSANDTAGRPLYPSLSPSNAPGAVGVGASNGIVLGTDFRVDQNITAGLIDESAFLLAPSAVAIWESPVTTLRVNVLTSGEVEIGMHGYIACSVLKAGGVRRFNLT